jgi:stage V sporulation protein AD
MKNRIVKLNREIYFHSYAATGGFEEMRGPLGKLFDHCDETNKFQQKTWEMAEGEMARLALNIALDKGNISHEDVDFVVAGDLQNQCVATSIGLSSFSIPYLGVYGACSTCTESLLISSAILQSDNLSMAAAVTSSHNSAAERQFRSPLEYGGQRTGTAQWTATAAGAFILSKEGSGAAITEFMIGKMVSGETTDASNMGGAMAFAAANTIIDYYRLGDKSFDVIITGDLGKVGSNILRDILDKEDPSLAKEHIDCGLLLYDDTIQDAHSGASGCGTSASVLATYFLPKIKSGEIKSALLISTGALMNPSSVLQKNPIYGIAPLIKICHKP